jgi:hypothetical protein
VCLGTSAVNIAARLESHGVPDRIRVSEAFRALTDDTFAFEERGTTGPTRTFFLTGICTYLLCPAEFIQAWGESLYPRRKLGLIFNESTYNTHCTALSIDLASVRSSTKRMAIGRPAMHRPCRR